MRQPLNAGMRWRGGAERFLRVSKPAAVDLVRREFGAVKRPGARRPTACLWLIIWLAGGFGTAAAQSGVAGAPLDLTPYKLRSVYVNNFSRQQQIAREEDFIAPAADGTWRRTGRPSPAAEWIAEGQGGVEIRDGQLRVAPLPFDGKGQPVATPNGPARSHMVVWNRRVFPADFLLSYEMSPNGSTNGLTIIFFCATGRQGEDIFEPALPPRRADYKTYHSGVIANYSDSYWSRNTEAESKSNRLRKNPGFQLVAEGPSLTTGPTNTIYHVRILKFGAHLAVEINGQVVFQWDDPDRPLGAGRIGLRSMEGVTVISYDNFRVWEVTRRTGAR